MTPKLDFVYKKKKGKRSVRLTLAVVTREHETGETPVMRERKSQESARVETERSKRPKNRAKKLT